MDPHYLKSKHDLKEAFLHPRIPRAKTAFTADYNSLIEIVCRICKTDADSGNVRIAEHTGSHENNEQYDNIILLPPFDTNPDEIISDIINCIENGLTSDGSSLAVVLPAFACCDEEFLNLRRHLIGSDIRHRFQTRIISLPLIYDREKIIILIIEKKASAGSIHICNFAHMEFADVDDAWNVSLKLNSIIEKMEEGDSRYCKLVDTAEIVDGDKFTPAYYFIDRAFEGLTSVEKSQLVPLKQLISIIPWKLSNNSRHSDKIVKTSTLSEDYLNSTIRFKRNPNLPGWLPMLLTEANGGYLKLHRNKILVGQIQDSEGEYVGIDHGIIHFKLNSGLISMDYLLKELTSPYVLEQARILEDGSPYNYFSREELLAIKIIIPALDKQNQMLLDDSKKGYADKSLQVQKNFDEFRKNMHMQKHKVGQTISVLSTWLNRLEKARKNGLKEDSDVVNPVFNTTVGDIYSNIQNTLKKLQTEIAAFDSSYGIEKDAKTFSLVDFLDSFCKNPCLEYEFIWDSLPHRYREDLKDTKAGDPMDYIYFPEKALETILENIIANAVAHGFTDPEKHNRIKFDIERDGTKVILLVSNNGQPLHKDMNPTEVFTYGHTSGDKEHSGIGGYQILEYMRAFGGNAEIISTPDSDYTVTYKLIFKDAGISEKYEQTEL